MISRNENTPNLFPPSYYENTAKKPDKSMLNDEKMNILNKKFIKKSKEKKIIIIKESNDIILQNSSNNITYSINDDLITKLFRLKDSGMIIKKSLIL